MSIVNSFKNIESSICKILKSDQIEIDLQIENIIDTAKSSISDAYKEAIKILEEARLKYKILADNPVLNPDNYYSLSGKQYDLKNFMNIDHLKYITKKESIISKLQSELLLCQDNISVEKRETNKSILANRINDLSDKLKILHDDLEACKFIVDASVKYRNQLSEYSEYQYRLNEAKKELNRWEKVVFILSPDGPLLNKNFMPNKNDLPIVPQGATVLSIMQPWAFLIANNYKSIECRNWRPGRKFMFPKEIYIHATNPKGDPCFLVKELQFYCRIAKLSGLKFYRYEPVKDDFVYGSIIAKAVLTEIIEFKNVGHYSQYADEHLAPYPYYSFKYGFKFINVEPVKPTPVKGKLQFWEYKNSIPHN